MTGMDEDAAQRYHDERQAKADTYIRVFEREADEMHYGGCWCCCWDCGFDYHAVMRGEGRSGQEFE